MRTVDGATRSHGSASDLIVAAVGGSFAAGPGIKPVTDKAAGRSGRNAAHLVSRALGGRLVDVSVSGATTANVLHEAQRIRSHSFRPQIESVLPGTDLVLVTAGGNDLQYIGSMVARAKANTLRGRRITRSFGRQMLNRSTLVMPSEYHRLRTATSLERIVVECRRRAPASRVLLVDYLPVLHAGSVEGPALPFTSAEIRHFRELAAMLSTAIETAAFQTGADLLPASAYGTENCVGSENPYTRGFEKHFGDGTAFHPTGAGMERVADGILALLGSNAD
ncbi:GDSL-like Lipase/Acylhydrolase family protein [Curtobacterium sp. UNCCL20]|nr:GDSL-like Lipase/Acylhydrolase family protein [Curtobacterium sp. UNCCL20]